MYEAHANIKEMIDKRDFENVQILLGDCQNTAIEIGTGIESSEGEGCVTIEYLEGYCEALYEIYIQLTDKYTGSKAQKILNKKLIRAENSVRNDIKIRYEVVFCPYKASMWDSLESVWKAASDDPDCDAYVVPIPYYDRDADYSLGKLHYEASLFPDYVPTVYYRTYNFEARRPDAIYIHNPYDDRNFVTSIDPRFYSRQLKRYTDCLVYIPYCVYDEPKSATDPKTLEYFERYITPVMFHADWIIFQSENFSRTFIKTVSSRTNISESIWNTKILSLGSPKYDKASASIAGADMNEAWKNKIFSDDGTKKKVIFYNTSLSMLLKYNEKMIDKISSVIAYFEQHQDNYLLLWRPHPLMEATIKAMRPDLWKRYQYIVEEYKRKDIGIYDDTPDYSVGFAVSDAYYGDFSSLVQLYQASGKMLLQQDVRVKDYCNSLDYVVSNNMYYDGEYIWATAMNYNGVYRIDPITFYAEYIGAFPDVELNGYFLYFGIVEKCNKLYFCPYKAGSIGVLDKKTLQLFSVKVDCQKLSSANDYYGISLFHENVIMTGQRNNTILILSTNTLELNYINICELFPHVVFDENDIMVRHLCKCENMLYTISPALKALLKFDPIKRTAEILSLEDELIDSEQLENDALYSDGKFLWMLQPYQECVIRLDSATGRVLQSISFAKEAKFIINGQYIYLFSAEQKLCYKIVIGIYECIAVNIGIKAEYVYNFGSKLMIVDSTIMSIKILDTESNELSEITIQANDILQKDYNISEMFRSYERQYDYTREDAFYNLGLLLEGIRTDSSDAISETPEPIGTQIYKTIKEKMS